MNALPKRRSMTLAEFLDWEERQEGRHEFVDGEITAMVGETVRHSQIVANIDRTLANRLMNSPCRVFRESVKVVAAEAGFYPDVLVTCAKLSDSDRMVVEPMVIVEVLSPSIEKRDLHLKSRLYRSIHSLKQYVVVAQEDLFVQSFVRKGEDWVYQTADGLDGVLALPPLGLELPLTEIYAGTALLAAALAAAQAGEA